MKKYAAESGQKSTISVGSAPVSDTKKLSDVFDAMHRNDMSGLGKKSTADYKKKKKKKK